MIISQPIEAKKIDSSKAKNRYFLPHDYVWKYTPKRKSKIPKKITSMWHEINIIPQDVNNGEDNEENTAQLLDNESNDTGTQNANEAQSENGGDENTGKSDEIQLDSD